MKKKITNTVGVREPAASEEPQRGWLGQPGIRSAALPGTADNGKCFSPIFPQREKAGKPSRAQQMSRCLVRKKDLQADAVVHNSSFKNRGVDFLCFYSRISMKGNCLI